MGRCNSSVRVVKKRDEMTAPDPVSQLLANHYRARFLQHGPTSAGVDWGERPDRHRLRIAKSLEHFRRTASGCDRLQSLLDVGSGYGATRKFMEEEKIDASYTGIDAVAEMVEVARASWPADNWVTCDFVTWRPGRLFDFVVCNGVLTQKLAVSDTVMTEYFEKFLKKMWSTCQKGITFNVMSSTANYFAPNLYYREPTEVLRWCQNSLSRSVVLDHGYGLYEFTVTVFRETDLDSPLTDNFGRE